MIDYIINVVIAARGYWMLAALVYAAYLFVPKETWGSVKTRSLTAKIALGIAIVGLLVGMFSPSNTYKFTTDYNKEQDIKRIQKLDEGQAMQSTAGIVDRTRKPASIEERAAGTVDFRERVTSQFGAQSDPTVTVTTEDVE